MEWNKKTEKQHTPTLRDAYKLSKRGLILVGQSGLWYGKRELEATT